MKNTIIRLAASITVMFTACNKSPVQSFLPESTQTPELFTQNVVEVTPASNPQNPYDYIGYYHNIGLDSLRHYVKANKDTTRQGKSNYLHRYFKSNFGTDVTPVYRPLEKQACTDYRPIWFNQKISVEALGYWHGLSDALQSIRDLDNYDSYKQQVIAIENKIQGTKLADKEKRDLLITASILRYSGYYWMNAFTDGSVTFHEQSQMDMPDGFLRKLAGVIVGIGADASIVAASYISGDYGMLGDAESWSEVCGYYTGWW